MCSIQLFPLFLSKKAQSTTPAPAPATKRPHSSMIDGINSGAQAHSGNQYSSIGINKRRKIEISATHSSHSSGSAAHSTYQPAQAKKRERAAPKNKNLHSSRRALSNSKSKVPIFNYKSGNQPQAEPQIQTAVVVSLFAELICSFDSISSHHNLTCVRSNSFHYSSQRRLNPQLRLRLRLRKGHIVP